MICPLWNEECLEIRKFCLYAKGELIRFGEKEDCRLPRDYFILERIEK